MDAYLLDWLHLLLRWAHVITAVAWIGASFHFVALDNSLLPPESDADRDKGVGGELWAVHGGGFYHQQKYPVSPPRLPDRLHWSLWESYSTWLTGFALFTAMYLVNAGTYLVDKSVFDWSPAVAAATALAFLAAFWLTYDGVCRVLGHRRHGDLAVGAVVAGLVVVASWAACELFAGRAAYLLVGAMLATAMSANVFFWIIPGQRKVVACLRAGQPVDPVHGRRGKQRSVHNTFFTLPVLVAMISNHAGWLHSAPHNWLWLVLLMAAGALIRFSFVRRHQSRARGVPVSWRHAAWGLVLLAVTVAALAPRPRTTAPASPSQTAAPAFAEVQAVVTARCTACHNEALANKGVRLDSPELIGRQAQAVFQQAVVQRTMPLNNATGMTDEERALVKRWFEAGAPGP